MKTSSFIVNRWVLGGGIKEHKIAFVVSQARGYEEYQLVRRQKTKPTYSHYSKSLLSSMFRKWV